jgi:hypothetical protein
MRDQTMLFVFGYDAFERDLADPPDRARVATSTGT